jgi:hypothetical protein
VSSTVRSGAAVLQALSDHLLQVQVGAETQENHVRGCTE